MTLEASKMLGSLGLSFSTSIITPYTQSNHALDDTMTRYALDDDDDDDDDNSTAAEAAKVSQAQERPLMDKADGNPNNMKGRDTAFKPFGTVPMDYDDFALKNEDQKIQEAEFALEALKAGLNEEEAAAKAKKKMEEKTAPFLDEGMLPRNLSMTRKNNPRFKLGDGDIQAASSMGSISDQLAKSVADIDTTKNSTAFGLRFGKSFRVGWSSDGSFLSIGKGGRITRSRPVFASRDDGKKQVDMLATFKSHALQHKTKTGSPLYTLPLNKGSSQHDFLGQALESYANLAGGTDTVAQDSFALLHVLHEMQIVDKDREQDPEMQRRFIGAFTQWLTNSCRTEVDVEIAFARAQYDTLGEILTAVSGGDLRKAAAVAQESGYAQLAVLLSSGPHGRNSISQEFKNWIKSGAASEIPTKLTRVYYMMAGDQSFEDDVYRRREQPSFDWRRRMLMNMSSPTLPSMLKLYQDAIAKGCCPFPKPPYLEMERSSVEIESVLYRLLRWGADPHNISLADVLNPLGCNGGPHDLSLSFHLASAMAAMGSPTTLSAVEQQALLDGYMAQLVSAGQWQWAVFVSLCSLRASDHTTTMQERHAKTLILQHYTEKEIQARIFLQDAGVPKTWFQEALAYRAATAGDLYTYLTHISRIDLEKARVGIEVGVVPNMLFMNNLEPLLETLEAVAVEGSLAKAILDLFDINSTIQSLEGGAVEHVTAELPVLRGACDRVQATLSQHKSRQDKLRQAGSLLSISGTYKVDIKSFLSEALRQVSLFRLQLKSLELGKSIKSSLAELLVLAQENDGASSMDIDAADTLRACI